MKNPEDQVLAIAESWASIDGKLDKFNACKHDIKLESSCGYYMGYMVEADELIERIRKRGFKIVKGDGDERS